MPNWCENRITIAAPKAAIKKLRSNIEKGKFLEAIDPSPSTRGERIDCWGTKWEAEIINVSGTENQLFISCLTAWSPPLGALQTFVDTYPGEAAVDIEYEEPSMDFSGTEHFGGGE